MMKQLLLFTFLFFLHLGVFAQTEINISSTKNEKIDPRYIESYSHMLVMRSFIKRKLNELTIKDKVTSRSLVFTPNIANSLGFGFNYEWLGLDVSFKLPQSEEDKNLGKTSAFDLQSNIYMRKFSIDLHLLKYQGYYIDNSSDLGVQDRKIYNGRLKSGLIGLSFNYIFNHRKFSYRAAYLQNERQNKSAGSFILGSYISYNYLDSDSTIIPERYVHLFNENALIHQGKFSQIGIQAGYAHTFVLKKFYLTLSLGLGIGIQHAETKNKENPHIGNEKNYMTTKGQFRGALGYNGDRFNCGLQTASDTYIFKDEGNTEIDYGVGSFRVFIAYRFKAPKFLSVVKKLKIGGGKKSTSSLALGHGGV